MKTINAKLLVLFLFVSSVTFAQVDYNDFDANRDGGIDATEFNEGYQDRVTDWDVDGDDFVSDREFYDYNYNRMANTRTGKLSQDDWNKNYDNNRLQDYGIDRDFNSFDTNRDGNIDNDEYYNAMRNSTYYSSFDANRDNKVDRNELGEGVFNEADQNRDGTLDQNEYKGFNSSFNRNNGTTRNTGNSGIRQ